MKINENSSASVVKYRKTVSCIRKKDILSYLYNLLTQSNYTYDTESMIHFGRNDDFFVLFDVRNNQRIFPDFLQCNPFCNSNLRANLYLHELYSIPSKNIENIIKNIVQQLVSVNTCNFRASFWHMNHFFDECQLLRAEYFCTTILESYVQKSENSFNFLECILNVTPFLFFLPVEFDERVLKMFEIFKSNLHETLAVKWFNLFKNHRETLEGLCNSRDRFMVNILHHNQNMNSYEIFLSLFEKSKPFRLHDFHAKIKRVYPARSQKSNTKLFAFLSGGILPFCLNITNEFNDLDIYLSMTPYESRDQIEKISRVQMFAFKRFFTAQFCMINKKCTHSIWQSQLSYVRDKFMPNFRFFHIRNCYSMNDECEFVNALKLCTNNHLPNIILYDAHGNNPLIDMASCIINFDLNICKNAWNLNFCRSMTNFNEILKLNFNPNQFFNYSSTRNSSLSEKYERMIIQKQKLNSTISNTNKKLIREKKYMNRLIYEKLLIGTQ